MKGGEAFRVALDALRANRLRSVLTMIGVIIGVAAVVVLVAIGTGAKNEVETQVEGLGSQPDPRRSWAPRSRRRAHGEPAAARRTSRPWLASLAIRSGSRRQ